MASADKSKPNFPKPPTVPDIEHLLGIMEETLFKLEERGEELKASHQRARIYDLIERMNAMRAVLETGGPSEGGK